MGLRGPENPVKEAIFYAVRKVTTSSKSLAPGPPLCGAQGRRGPLREGSNASWKGAKEHETLRLTALFWTVFIWCLFNCILYSLYFFVFWDKIIYLFVHIFFIFFVLIFS